MSKPVDRQTTTPFLLNLYYRAGPHHNPNDFLAQPIRQPHLQLYTWQDATLREISQLITSALPSAFPSPLIGTRLSYQMMYPDTKPNTPPRYMAKSLGSVVLAANKEDMDGDADRSLGDSRFIIGDYISVSILAPLANGDVAPVSAAIAMPSRGGRDDRDWDRGPRDPYRDRERGGTLAPPRENGFGGGRFGGGGGSRGGRYGDFGPGSGVPPGEWRRGDEPPGGRRDYGGPRDGGYGRPRGRGRGW